MSTGSTRTTSTRSAGADSVARGTRRLLIAGGEADPSLPALAAAAQRLGVEPVMVCHGAEGEPEAAWDLSSDRFEIGGAEIAVDGVFLRYDVFGGPAVPGSPDRAGAWYALIQGWASAHPAIRQFNHALNAHAGVKPAELMLARHLGLEIPRTLITNALDRAGAFAEAAIAKPVGGGSYVRRLDRVLAEFSDDAHRAPLPAIVQERLEYPEYRVFLIKGERHVFSIRSEHLDYRPHRDNRMEYLGAAPQLGPTLAQLQALADLLGCDFCACDLKTRAGSEVPIFLEINTGPMFAAYDRCAGGLLCEAMVRALTG